MISWESLKSSRRRILMNDFRKEIVRRREMSKGIFFVFINGA